jgi:hypothetical protein
MPVAPAPSTTSTGFNVVEAGPPPPPTVLAALTIKPGGLRFPTEVVLGTDGKISPSQAVTLVNPKNKAQDLPITIQSLAATDSSYIVAQNCLGTLQPGAQCKVTLTFKPDSPGPHFAWLQVGGYAVNGNEEVALRGIGRPGAISITPSALNFGKVAPGGTPTRLVTLRNPNPIAMDIQSIEASAPYAASNNCVGTLAGHGTCKVTATFNAPNTAGKAPGTLTIDDDAIKSPQPVKLMATG